MPSTHSILDRHMREQREAALGNTHPALVQRIAALIRKGAECAHH